MELRFVSPTLASLDELEAETLLCSVWSDARPSHGVAGLCDFRMAGWLSELERARLVTGALGEVVLVPGRPKTTFDKIVLFGAGPRASFGIADYRMIVQRMLATMDGLGARAGVVELPGRQDELIPAEQAADELLAVAGREREHDVWYLVERAEARRRITEHMIEQRRRIRRVP